MPTALPAASGLCIQTDILSKTSLKSSLPFSAIIILTYKIVLLIVHKSRSNALTNPLEFCLLRTTSEADYNDTGLTAYLCMSLFLATAILLLVPSHFLTARIRLLGQRNSKGRYYDHDQGGVSQGHRPDPHQLGVQPHQGRANSIAGVQIRPGDMLCPGANEGPQSPQGIDFHLVTSCGMEPNNIVVKVGGYLFLVDGISINKPGAHMQKSRGLSVSCGWNQYQ